MKTIRTSTRYGEMSVPVSDTYVGRSLIEYGEWTQSEIAVLEQVVRPGMKVLDIGANVGYHALALARAVGETGSVMAFEPQPFLFQLLAANTINAAIGNILCFNMAIGEGAGVLDMPLLNYAEPYNYAAIDVRLVLRDERAVTEEFPIPVRRLDDLPVIHIADLIKIDVEGMELAVLQGAKALLQRCRPILFVENEHSGQASEQLLGFLTSLDYECYWQAAPCFSPENFKGNSTNVFGNFGCINILALPRERNQSIEGVLKVQDVREHPRSGRS